MKRKGPWFSRSLRPCFFVRSRDLVLVLQEEHGRFLQLRHASLQLLDPIRQVDFVILDIFDPSLQRGNPVHPAFTSCAAWLGRAPINDTPFNAASVPAGLANR
jgi:hypothetical protein